MIFNIENARRDPEIRRIIGKRDSVFERFGPIFRETAQLTKQNYLDFLDSKQNYHWTGLERLGRPAADDMDNLRDALNTLLDESLPLAARFDAATSQIDGVAHATLTPILLIAYETRYGVWNDTSELEMKRHGLWPTFPPSSTDGEKYELINPVLVGLAKTENTDLWTLDALWWAGKNDLSKTGHHTNDWENSAMSMVIQAEQTAKQSNGQLVSRTVKNKELRMSRNDLYDYINALLKEAKYQCAITGIELQTNGPDLQLRPSLDRIDSEGHYETGNLQVVARFINFWKSNTPDSEFRRQVAMVRKLPNQAG